MLNPQSSVLNPQSSVLKFLVLKYPFCTTEGEGVNPKMTDDDNKEGDGKEKSYIVLFEIKTGKYGTFL